MKNKLIRGIIALIITISISITAVNLINKSRSFNITITETFFGPYGNQYHDEVLPYNINSDDEIKVNDGSGGKLTFKMIKASNNSVRLQASEELIQVKSDFFPSPENEFVIVKDEETKLNRLTTGSGVSYTILLD